MLHVFYNKQNRFIDSRGEHTIIMSAYCSSLGILIGTGPIFVLAFKWGMDNAFKEAGVKMEKIALIQYSEAFKKQVVKEYETGVSAERLRQKYGIKGHSTINSWVKKYRREGSRYELMVIQKPAEQQQVKELKKGIQELESALAQMMLDKMMLESLVEVIEEEEGIEVKKTSDSGH